MKKTLLTLIEMLELSLVNVPANQSANILAVKAAAEIPDDGIPDDVGPAPTDPKDDEIPADVGKEPDAGDPPSAPPEDDLDARIAAAMSGMSTPVMQALDMLNQIEACVDRLRSKSRAAGQTTKAFDDASELCRIYATQLDPDSLAVTKSSTSLPGLIHEIRTLHRRITGAASDYEDHLDQQIILNTFGEKYQRLYENVEDIMASLANVLPAAIGDTPADSGPEPDTSEFPTPDEPEPDNLAAYRDLQAAEARRSRSASTRRARAGATAAETLQAAQDASQAPMRTAQQHNLDPNQLYGLMSQNFGPQTVKLFKRIDMTIETLTRRFNFTKGISPDVSNVELERILGKRYATDLIYVDYLLKTALNLAETVHCEVMIKVLTEVEKEAAVVKADDAIADTLSRHEKLLADIHQPPPTDPSGPRTARQVLRDLETRKNEPSFEQRLAAIREA